MENNQELFKQAILDAKAVRETAMAAARTTLAEHFEPFIKQSMQETLSEDDTEDSTMEESTGDQMEEDMKNDIEERTLDQMLRELDDLADNSDLEEGHVSEDGYVGKKGKGNSGYSEKARATHGDHKLHEANDDDETEDFDDEDPVEDEPMGGDAQEVVDITVGELKDIIRDVFMQLQGGGEDLGDDQETFDTGDDTEMADDMDMDSDEDSKEISLEEILAELEEEEKRVEEAKRMPHRKTSHQASNGSKPEKMQDDLEEAVKTIKTLKTELNEVNLFSAKMLYVNKLFKAKNLTESQKTKVINAFDRASSVKEVENTYRTLLESVGETKKSTLRESVGFASKAIGSAPARPIVEADAFVTRWQQLAGISK